MSLLDVLRSGVRIANNVTRPLQSIVMYRQQIGGTGYGATLADPKPLHVIVQYKTVQVRTGQGVVTATRAHITLLDVAEVVAATGGTTIKNGDVFTLPDGTNVGPTLDLDGFLDAGDGTLIPTTVMQG